jgi:hypothetical protein
MFLPIKFNEIFITILITVDYIFFLLSCQRYNPYFFFFDHRKKAKSLLLAPIVVEILVARGSGHKIVTDSGTMLTEKH